MPKRRRDETEEERWHRKMRKYESKLRENRRINYGRPITYSDDEYDAQIEEHLDDEPMYRYYPVNENPSPVEVIECAEPEPAATAPPVEPTKPPEPNNVAARSVDAAVVSNPQPSSSNSDATPADQSAITDIDQSLLESLGELQTETIEWGDDLLDDISKRLQPILQQGLKKETREELEKKYLFPKNVPLAKAPTLNPEISSMLTESSKNRDKRIASKQNQLGRALSALGKAMTHLVKKNPDLSSILKMLNDTSKIIADSHYAETETRRSLITPLVDKSLIESFKDRKRDDFLFGDKLGDLVKNSRGIKKIGQSMQSQPSIAVGSALNWKGPSSRSRPQRGGQATRAGGHRTPYPYPTQLQYAGRRRALPPPHGGARRQYPPPASSAPARRALPPPPAQPARLPPPASDRTQT